MNIVLLYKHAPWIAAHVLPSFASLDAKVLAIDIRGIDREQLGKNLDDVFEIDSIDLLFMLECFDTDISQETLENISSRGAIIVNYLVDTPQDWWKSKNIAPACDLVLSAQSDRLERLKHNSNDVALFPFAVSESFAHDATAVEPESQVSASALFIGSAHSRWRLQFIAEVASYISDLEVGGTGWLEARGTETSAAAWSSPAGAYTLSHHVERALGGGGFAMLGAVAHRLMPLPPLTAPTARFLGPLTDQRLKSKARNTRLQISTSVHGSGFMLGRTERQMKLRDIEMLCFARPYATDVPTHDASGLNFLRYNRVSDLAEINSAIGDDSSSFDAQAKALQAQVLENYTWRTRFQHLGALTGLPIRIRSPTIP